MHFLALLLLLGSEGEPPEIRYAEPQQITWTEPVKKQPAWLDAQYKYPDWTYPGSIYTHLFEEPHYSRLKAAGYTDKQLRSISVREAELLHNHLHNYYGKFDSGANVKVYSPVSSST